MILEKQVCSLELSKRLKELGVKQDSIFYWRRWIPIKGSSYRTPEWLLSYYRGSVDDYELISAFTVAELGELLPYLIEYESKKYWYHTGKVNKNNKYYKEHEVNYINDETTIGLARGNTETDARAEILIYFLEHKLMELPNE